MAKTYPEWRSVVPLLLHLAEVKPRQEDEANMSADTSQHLTVASGREPINADTYFTFLLRLLYSLTSPRWILTPGTACQHLSVRGWSHSVSVLTCFVCRHNVLGDGDSVLWAASPVHHAPPAFHREIDVSVSCHRPLVNAQDWTQKGDRSNLFFKLIYTVWTFCLCPTFVDAVLPLYQVLKHVLDIQ